MAQEPLELVQADRTQLERAERTFEKEGRVVLRLEGRPGPRQMQRVEAPRGVRQDAAAFVIPRVERLEGMCDDHGLAGAAPGHRHGVVHHVEQLTDRDGRRAGQVGPLVAAGVGHDEVLPGGQQGVEEQLPVLAADVAVPHALVVER